MATLIQRLLHIFRNGLELRKRLIQEIPIRHSISKERLDELVDEAKSNLQRLSKIVMDGLHPPAGAYAFFNHNVHAMSRVEDCKRILDRMYKQIHALVYLALEGRKYRSWPAGTPYPEAAQKIFRREDEINKYTQQDLESLYMFGGMLLDQWAIQAIAVGNLPIGKKDPQKMHPFVDLVKFFENDNKSRLDVIWNDLKEEMLWLHYQLRFYRNRFIVHANRPWQRGTTRSSLGEEYNFHIPTPPGFLDDEALDNEIRKLIRFAPKRIQDAPDDYWEKARPGALIERIFNNIGNIPSREDREKVAEVFGEKGGSTPTFQIVAERLLHFVASGTNHLCDIASANLQDIDLGRPHRTSREMWEAGKQREKQVEEK